MAWIPIAAAAIGAAGNIIASSMNRGRSTSSSSQVSPPQFRPETQNLLAPMAQTATGKLGTYNVFAPFFLQGALGSAANFLTGGRSGGGGGGTGFVPEGGAPAPISGTPLASNWGVPADTALKEKYRQHMQNILNEQYQKYLESISIAAAPHEGYWIPPTPMEFEEWVQTLDPNYLAAIAPFFSEPPMVEATYGTGIPGTGGIPWSPQYLSWETPAFTPYQDIGESTALQSGIQNLQNILGGYYDPARNPLGYQLAFQTSAAPLIQSFKEEVLPLITREAIKMGGAQGSGAILARQMAADRLANALSTLAGNIYGQREQLGAQMLGQALGQYLPTVLTAGPQMEQARRAAEASFYQPLAAQAGYGAAQYSPYLAAIQASYAPILQQMQLAQSALGMLQPQWTDILNLLQATSGGASATQMAQTSTSPNYLAAALSGAAGGLDLYKTLSDLWKQNTSSTPTINVNIPTSDYSGFNTSFDYGDYIW